MRVKELYLQGFKSFAGRHRFVFPPGITAIVGPNGSGKSNIADGVRWVLGEQRATLLRAKRADEIVFGGTDRRSRAGLAEVSLVLDNDDRWLDVDFHEVAIGRRAQRDGVNTYLINGAPVRLRDVADLVGGHISHGGYTVIGQGMVDSALSLRPEERRVLIDEAAGLVPMQRRRDKALERLAETNDNLTRVSDILEEIGPRLRRMARLSERAARHDGVAGELRGLLRAWYGYHWHTARSQRDRQRELVLELRREVDAARERQADATRDVARIEEQRSARTELLDAARSARQAAAARLAEARQAAAVAQARLDGLESREAEQAASLSAETGLVDDLRRRIGELEVELAAIEEEVGAAEARLESARTVLRRAEVSHASQTAAVDEARAGLLAVEARASALRDRLAELDAGRAEVLDEREAALAKLAEAEAKQATLQSSLDDVQSEVAEAERASAEAVLAVSSMEDELSALDATLAESRDAMAAATRELEALRGRSEALEALFGGVDHAQEAVSRLRQVPGVRLVGTVAQLLVVEPGWEAAVAAALGEHVHGVVLGSPDEVVTSLALADPDAKGALTLVPIGRAGAPHRPWEAGADEQRAEDVASSPEAPGLVDALLGGTAFAQHLDSATDALLRPDGPARVATREGRLILPHGVIVTGAPGRELIAIEAERRELPAVVAAAAARADEIGDQVDRLASRRRGLESSLSELVAARREHERGLADATERAEELRVALGRAERDVRWWSDAAERLAQADEVLCASRRDGEAELAALALQLDAAQRTLESSQQGVDSSGLQSARGSELEASTAAAELGQELAGRRATLEAARADLARLISRLDEERRRRDALVGERDQLVPQIEALRETSEKLVATVDETGRRQEDLEAELRDLDRGRTEVAAGADSAARQLAAVESRLTESRLAEARAEDRLGRLGEQIVADGEILVGASLAAAAPGVDHVDGGEGAAAGSDGAAPATASGGEASPDASASGLPVVEPTWDLASLTASLPLEADQPDSESEARIDRLRRELRAIGAIDRDALADFRETTARYEHLEAERADLQAAEGDLLQLLEQLESEMAQRFEATFAGVAEAFRSFFPQLFGGGEAELTLDRDGDAIGIDIVARPPGKRRQPLGLLSGGERSLTAVALIFSLLQVSRTPFVVLDEVDAALDEANVARFRSALESLAESTQVVIITHNRGTIQAADTVYGITMSEDGASQVVSLQVPR